MNSLVDLFIQKGAEYCAARGGHKDLLEKRVEYTLEGVPKKLRDEIEDIYDDMVRKYMISDMDKYLTPEHKTDFILGVFATIDSFRGVDIENDETADQFYDFLWTNVKFFFWNRGGDRLSECQQICVNFIVNKIK